MLTFGHFLYSAMMFGFVASEPSSRGHDFLLEASPYIAGVIGYGVLAACLWLGSAKFAAVAPSSATGESVSTEHLLLLTVFGVALYMAFQTLYGTIDFIWDALSPARNLGPVFRLEVGSHGTIIAFLVSAVIALLAWRSLRKSLR